MIKMTHEEWLAETSQQRRTRIRETVKDAAELERWEAIWKILDQPDDEEETTSF